ncbi:phage integrase family protein [Nonlabens dokdonensis]|nr:tyrosine-type recombinase/integrase [Nonlabens dokdonensis]PZX41086.1 phage integrase family protein [Nonlabens dokdonensis]
MSKVKRTTGSINFRLKKGANIEQSIYMDFSNGRDFRLKYSIGYAIDPKYWDSAKKRVKNVAVVRNSNEINDLMRDLESETFDYVSDCDSKQIAFTRNDLKEHLKRFTNKSSEIIEEQEPTTFLEFIESHINRKEKELPVSKGRSISATVSTYKQTQNHLIQFEKESGYKLDFNTIDEEFYSEFLDYMNNKTYGKDDDKYYSINTIGKQIKNLIGFMNAALYAELHTNFKFKKFKVSKETTTAVFLTMDELITLYKTELDKTHYILARDVFLIGCEIGQRISDYHDLASQEIQINDGVNYIKIKQEKTGKEVLCRITPVIQQIMDDRYNGELPPKIAPQKLNDYIKKVAQKAKINRKIKTEQTIGGKKITKYTEKYKLIMSHTARRTFCTLKYKSGMDVHHIMELSGHTTTKEFLKYIRAPKDDIIAQITSTKEFESTSIPIE